MNAIEVQGLQKVYRGKIKAIDNLSFSVPEGSVFGFLGPNGAGKSTAIKILVTLIGQTTGTARIFDVDVARHPKEIRRMIGYVPQELSADAALTGYENLLLSAKLYDIPKKVRDQRIAEILDMMELTSRADSLIDTYSGGMVRRLEIGQAMLHHPRLLFLDEPTIGLDPAGRALVWRQIRKLNHDEGMTIFLTTHYMEEAEVLCTKIGIIDRGTLSAVGSPTELKEKVGVGTIHIIFSTIPAAETITSELTKQLPEAIVSFPEPDILEIKIADPAEHITTILTLLKAMNLTIKDMELRGPTLEDVFLRFTGSRLEQAGGKEWKAIKQRRRSVRRST
jgi:ABC-2 type transport system ATP-binding protein